MKLEPTEAQRKAMAEKLLAGTPRWAPPIFTEESALKAVDEMFAAANSIPEGAPVGTIARRPDGFWIAHMTESGWEYTELVTGTWRGSDADSWPQIRPDEWPDQVGLDWFPPGEEPIAPRPDPTAQQEPERFPGIENPTTADHVGADNADEQLKLIFALQCIRVERGLSVADIGEALGLEDSEVERFESGSTNPTMSMIRRYARAVEAVFTVDVRKWEDTPAQQEPATTHPVSPESTNCVPKPLGDPS